MTKDDIETFETRLSDKVMFQNIAIALVTGGVPLGTDKLFSYMADHKANDLAVVIVCAFAIFFGITSFLISMHRNKKIQTFKDRLFGSERLLSRTFAIVDASTGTAPAKIISKGN